MRDEKDDGGVESDEEVFQQIDIFEITRGSVIDKVEVVGVQETVLDWRHVT